jgi:hypothetical protein
MRRRSRTIPPSTRHLVTTSKPSDELESTRGYGPDEASGARCSRSFLFGAVAQSPSREHPHTAIAKTSLCQRRSHTRSTPMRSRCAQVRLSRRKEETMDLLAILGIGALVRLFKRRRTPSPTNTVLAAPPDPIATVALSHLFQVRPQIGSARWRLLRRAIDGALIAFVLVVFALLRWPTAWATSAACAPLVHMLQASIRNNVDLITIGAISLAVLEPLIAGVARRLLQLPRAIWLLSRLAWVYGRIGYWRARNWRLRRSYHQHLARAS